MNNYQYGSLDQLLTRNRLLQLLYEVSPHERESIAIAIDEVCQEILKRRQESGFGAIAP